MVFQSFNLIATMTAWENIALALAFAGVRRAERRRRAEALLAQVGTVVAPVWPPTVTPVISTAGLPVASQDRAMGPIFPRQFIQSMIS